MNYFIGKFTALDSALLAHYKDAMSIPKTVCQKEPNN